MTTYLYSTVPVTSTSHRRTVRLLSTPTNVAQLACLIFWTPSATIAPPSLPTARPSLLILQRSSRCAKLSASEACCNFDGKNDGLGLYLWRLWSGAQSVGGWSFLLLSNGRI